MTAPALRLPSYGRADPEAPPAPALDDALAQQEAQEHAAAEAMYGRDFPLLDQDENTDDVDEAAWVRFARSLVDSRSAAVAERLHMAYRNRRMAAGDQWISSISPLQWRTPPATSDQARVVWNVIKPALNLRLDIITDQRPGFRTSPTRFTADAMQKAEARQAFLEYQWNQQKLLQIIREAGYWAQRDGVSFLHVHWEPEAGPWEEYTVPTGTVSPQGEEEQEAVSMPAGDIRTRVYRMDQVYVSANATANERPYFWVLRDEIPVGAAVQQHDASVADTRTTGAGGDMGNRNRAPSTWWQRTDDEDARFLETKTTERLIVYLERSSVLPNGLMFIVVGDTVVLSPMPLPTSKAPVVRLTDGSSDPAFYPAAVMEDWLDEQVQINAAASKWVDAIRRGAGGQMVARAGAVSTDTLVAGLTRIIEVNDAGPVGDAIQWIHPPEIGQDILEFIKYVKEQFENKSGDTPAARGQFSAEASGRAILAQREALERIFTPSVMAAANASQEWGMHSIDWARWGYDEAREIAVVGNNRGYLARMITAEDMDGVADVIVDPETLMPLPRAMRLFLLDDLYAKKVIDANEYRRRLPFGFVQQIDSHDTDHTNRAKRIVDAIKRVANGEQVPIPPLLWQDNEAIHQDVLERDLILDDESPEQARQLALQRWTELANQQQQKMGGGPPQPGAPGPPMASGVKKPQMPPRIAPMLGTSPGMASAPARLLAGGGDAQSLGATFDRTTPS